MQSRTRQLTIIGRGNPALRRNSHTGLSILLRKSSLNQPFLSGYEDNSKKLTLRETEALVKNHFQKINGIIDNVDEFMTCRLQNYQNQVLAVMKGQIQQMKQQTAKIVKQINQRILELSADEEIYNLQNELNYFKNQAYKLFQQNNKYRGQIVQLKKSIKEFELQAQNGDALMQRLKKRVMKQKFVKQQFVNKIVSNLTANPTKQQFELIVRQNINDDISNKIQTDNFEKRTSLHKIINQQHVKTIKNENSLQQNDKKSDIKSISSKHSISSVSHREERLLDQDDDEINQLDSINLNSEKPTTQQPEHLKEQSKLQIEIKQIQIGVQTDLNLITSETSKLGKQLVPSQFVEKSKQLTKYKDINLMRNGFIINSPKLSLPKNIEASQIQKSQKRRRRFMSSAFTNNKLPYIQDTIVVLQKTPKSSNRH